MTMGDFKVLEREHDSAIAKATSAATVIAELVVAGKQPEKSDIDRYVEARLGVESTRRDIETCLATEIDMVLNPTEKEVL